MNIKKIISMSALVVLSGAKCWGAAAPEKVSKKELNKLLKEAAKVGNADMVKALIEAKANVKSARSDGPSALELALENEHHDTVRLLLEHGAGDADSLQALAARAINRAVGYKVTSADGGQLVITQEQIDALPEAAQECIMLEKYKHYLDESPLRGLMYAIFDNSPDAVRFFLRKYRSELDLHEDMAFERVKGCQEYVSSALMAAVTYGCADIVRILLAHGSRVDYRGQIVKNTALTEALRSREAGYFEVVQVLIEAIAKLNEEDKKAQLNQVDGCGMTALMYAAEKGDAAMVQALIAAGADVNALNTNDGQKETALGCVQSGRELYLLIGPGSSSTTEEDTSAYDTVIAILQAAGAQ